MPVPVAVVHPKAKEDPKPGKRMSAANLQIQRLVEKGQQSIVNGSVLLNRLEHFVQKHNWADS